MIGSGSIPKPVHTPKSVRTDDCVARQRSKGFKKKQPKTLLYGSKEKVGARVTGGK